jgi:hypothetical protein
MFEKNYQPPFNVDYSSAASILNYCQTFNGNAVCGGEAISSPLLLLGDSQSLSSHAGAPQRWRTRTSNFGGNATKRESTNEFHRKVAYESLFSSCSYFALKMFKEVSYVQC